MRLPTTFLAWLTFTSLSSQSIQFQDYFPLKRETSNRYYVSHIANGDTSRAKSEVSFCRSMVVKSKEIFYFADKDDKGDTSIIGSNAFCDGVFYFENGIFFFSPLSWKYEIKNANIDYFEPLFPAIISIDTNYIYRDGNKKLKYRFTGFENIIIRGKEYEDCLKLIVVQDWPTAQYTDTVWFKKEIGVVKWLRSTGRLEELKI